ncbi:hypothetical protein [Glycomyces buryatensis]|uniref:TROVE domain-containing protein n=1 Tax=Glycomyces buryatensis TaxID=2570927 RepID=A0A4S8Q1T0_9ACTN|nr:hypothetical protein [Glycomyces buryatensis]THV36435.1 hypothetical protein FAB82_21855 [Glycomyces buryatensis]
METVADLAAAEDVLLFVNAAIASTGQREFHSDVDAQRWSLEFLHEYMLVNYRDLYAATLTLSVNDRNAATIILRLLQTGRDVSPAQRALEGRLIAKALRALPTNRVYRLFTALRRERVNNRRTRAIMREWLSERPDLTFDAIKYRSAFRDAVRHAHLRVDDLPHTSGDAAGELAAVLFNWRSTGRFRTPQFETWRRAHFDRRAVFELPYTVAEGFAAKHRITRVEFLEKIAPQMTRGERLRLQRSAARVGATGVASDFTDLSRMPLTRLAAFVLALPVVVRESRRAELAGALRAAALRVVGPRAGTWGSVAAVLDDSYSSSGSSEKRRRPLVVALASHFLLEALATEYRPLWLSGDVDPLMARARGVTALGDRILDGLESRPELLIVVSDGWDNAPVGMAAAVLRVWEERIDPARSTTVAHLNPVFDAAGLQVRRLSPSTPTVGIRDAENLPELVAFARFATGRTGIAELRAHITAQVDRWLAEEAPCAA